MTMNLDGQYLNGVMAIVVFGLALFFVSILSLKSITIRRIIFGVPTVIIQNGKLLEKPLRSLKIDVNDLLEQCRSNGYFNLEEIEYAIMEANGKISILPKAEYKPATPQILNLKVSKEGLCANVVIDGKLMKNNIKNMKKDDEWVLHELKVKGYNNLDKILLATLDINDKITVYEKNNSVNIYNVLE